MEILVYIGLVCMIIAGTRIIYYVDMPLIARIALCIIIIAISLLLIGCMYREVMKI